MAESFDAADLQALWDDLNQDPEQQQARDLQQRLRQRAMQYARVPDHEAVTDDHAMQVLVLRVGTELYGIDVMCVRGIRPLETVTRVPGVPHFYRGVVNVRGQILSLLDLRRFLDLPSSDGTADDPDELVLVESADLYLALLVERVMNVAVIQRSQITPIDARFALGVTTERLVLLDVDSLLNDKRLIIGGEIER